MVMYAPGGIASLIMMNLRLAAFGRLGKIWFAYIGLGFTALMGMAGAAAMIEMVYHMQLNSALGPLVKFAGVTLDTEGVNSWFGSVFVMLTGIGLFEVARRHYLRDWNETQEYIEKEVKRREAL